MQPQSNALERLKGYERPLPESSPGKLANREVTILEGKALESVLKQFHEHICTVETENNELKRSVSRLSEENEQLARQVESLKSQLLDLSESISRHT